jgi:hypothetical protein
MILHRTHSCASFRVRPKDFLKASTENRGFPVLLPYVLTSRNGLIRVRRLHESGRPRALRPAFRDTEARRGASGSCGEESESARPKTKTSFPLAFFPRRKRPTLKRLRCGSRFSHLAGDFGISQALPHDMRNREVEAVTVVHRTGFGRAIVEAPRLLVQVAEQMERFHTYISTANGPFEQAPKIFQSVSVDAAIDVARGMVDHLVRESRAQILIGHERIGVDRAARLDVLVNLAVERVLAATRNDGGTDLSATFEDTHHGSLAADASRRQAPLPPARVHVASLAADESFVYFDFAAVAAELHGRTGLQGQPDTLKHEPRGFLSDSQRTVNLPRANAVFAVGEHPHCREPLVEADRRVLENGTHLHGELAFRMAGLALPHPARGNEAHVCGATGRAHDAITPAPCYEIGEAVVRVREIFNRLLESFGFVCVSHNARILQETF